VASAYIFSGKEREREREREGGNAEEIAEEKRAGEKGTASGAQMGRRGDANFIECEFTRPILFPVINLVARVAR